MTLSAPSASSRAAALPRSGVLLLALLSLAWGLNWPAMKVVLAEVPVWSFRALCLIGGAAGLFLAAAALRQRIRLRAEEIRPVVVCSLFNMVGWHLLSAYGLHLIGAGKAAIIGFTMPLWAALLGPLLFRERVTREILLGLLLGGAGLGLLLLDDIAALDRSPLGSLVMLGAALSWALGTLFSKRVPASLPTVSFTAWQLGLGAPVLTLGALLLEGLPSFGSLSWAAWGCLIYAVVIAVIFCHWAWFSVVKLLPAIVAAIGTLAIPVVGFLSSALLLHEPLGWREAAALLLVCGGLAVVLVLPSLARLKFF